MVRGRGCQGPCSTPSPASTGHFHFRGLRPSPAAGGMWWVYRGDQEDREGYQEGRLSPPWGRAQGAWTSAPPSAGSPTTWAPEKGRCLCRGTKP